MNTIGVWFAFTRPKTLVASIMPIISAVPIALASADFSFFRGGCFMGVALLLQIACNFNNDYYDFKRGSDREDRVGPRRVLQQKLLTPEQVKYAIYSTFALAALLIIYLAIMTHLIIFIIGIVAMMVAYLYTGGKYPLGYHGWGECAAFLFFGPVIVFSAVYIMAGHLWGMLFSTSMLAMIYGCFAYMLIAVNNLRDVEADSASRKRTLTVRWGRSFTCYSIYGSLGVIAGATSLLGYSETSEAVLYFYPPLVLLGGLYLGKLEHHAPSALNGVLGRVGILMTVYTLVLTTALLLT